MGAALEWWPVEQVSRVRQAPCCGRVFARVALSGSTGGLSALGRGERRRRTSTRLQRRFPIDEAVGLRVIDVYRQEG